MGLTRKDKRLKARWVGIQGEYRRRHREWTMRVLPSMPEDQWKEYTKWAAAFGTGTRGRKLQRQLSQMKLRPKVTATVTDSKAFKTAVASAIDKGPGKTLILFREIQAVVTIDDENPRRNNVRLIPGSATRRK